MIVNDFYDNLYIITEKYVKILGSLKSKRRESFAKKQMEKNDNYYYCYSYSCFNFNFI